MVANLTTPLIGIVSTTAIGRLGDATLLGGVAMASVIFDCLFWLFGFLRMSTLAFTAQSLGAGETEELRPILMRGLIVAALIGAGLIILQIPLAAILFTVMGGSEGVTRAAKIYFTIRIWSAPLALANYVVLGWLIGQARARLALGVQIAINVINMAATALLVLVLEAGIAGAAIAAVTAEAAGLVLGVLIAGRLSRGQPAVPRTALLDRPKLIRMLAVNRDIMIRTASLIAVFLFFTSQGARSGDLTLAANAVLNNFLLMSSFFLDGLANAAEQLCGRACGARAKNEFSDAVRLVVLWGFGFALAVTAAFALFGSSLIDMQYRVVGSAVGPLCRARRLAGAALSGTGARLIPAEAAVRLKPKGEANASAICRLRRRARFRRPVQHLLSYCRRARQFPDRLRRIVAAGAEAAGHRTR